MAMSPVVENQRVERSRVAAAGRVPPIDLAHLRRYTLGDVAIEREILDLFFAQMPETIAALRTAQTCRDARRAAHTLKGSARAIGAWAIAKLAEDAEALTGFGDEPFDATAGDLTRLLTGIDEEGAVARAFAKAIYSDTNA